LIRRRLNEESGYSLVEVMVSIMLLAIAILPMVGMFDMGLNTANRGSNYDKARTLANTVLEQAKMLDYETVRTDFPSQALNGNGPPVGSNSITSSSVTIAQDPERVPQGFCYVVTKQYLQQPPTGVPPDEDPGEEVEFNPSTEVPLDTDTGLLKVTVRVSWRGDLALCNTNPYQTSGVVAL
jgi:prepilin-type N-terminal cleavage/methylation domain-containing protein